MSSAAPMEDEVVLRRGAGGVALSAPLLRIDGPDTLRSALQLGFSSALAFDAGLACEGSGGGDGDGDGPWLLLSRWVDCAQKEEPGGEPDAPAIAAARAELLEQRASWLALLPAQGVSARRQVRPEAGLEARQRQRLHRLLERTAS